MPSLKPLSELVFDLTGRLNRLERYVFDQARRCPACGGHGRKDYASYEGELHESTCEDCRGSGWVPKAREGRR